MRWCRFGADFFVCDGKKHRQYLTYGEFLTGSRREKMRRRCAAELISDSLTSNNRLTIIGAGYVFVKLKPYCNAVDCFQFPRPETAAA